MSGYLIVICVILIMFAGLAIFIVQASADEHRFMSEHDPDAELDAETGEIDNQDPPKPVDDELTGAPEDQAVTPLVETLIEDDQN